MTIRLKAVCFAALFLLFLVFLLPFWEFSESGKQMVKVGRYLALALQVFIAGFMFSQQANSVKGIDYKKAFYAVLSAFLFSLATIIYISFRH